MRFDKRSKLGSVTGFAVFAAILLSSLVLTALQPTQAQTNGTMPRIALVTDALFSDGGWGAAAFNAAKQLETNYGYEVAYAENIAIPEIETTLRQYSQDGYNLIIAHGFEWGDPAVRVGAEFPDTKYVVFTGLVNSSNVASIFPMQQEGSFLLGALGAMMTQTGAIGYVGGDRYPNIINIFQGFQQGAKHINPDIRLVGTYIGDFDNPAGGKEAGLAQINSGADFLFHVADTSGHGVIEAAKERGLFAFGAVSDQNALAPDTVLTSFVLDMDKAFDQIVRTVVENRFEGKIYKPGLEVSKGAPGEGIVYLAPFHNLEGRVPEDVKQRLNQLTQDIINKAIVVPEKYEVTTDFSQKSSTATTIAKTEPKILKIALVTDGLFSDGGWSAAAYNAAKQLETNYGHNLTYVDNIAISDIENTLRQYSEDGYDLIIAHGFQWGDPAVRVGIEYPNTKYVVFTGLVASNNVASIFPMQQEATFLLGALAVMMSRTGTIGYVGGDKLDNFLTSVENKIVWKYQGDAKYRRVVPSPKPVAILEYPIIRSLANSGYIVIACGGGGIPVITGGDDDEKVVGIDAVIDKDLAGELLARQIGAQKFIILTDVKGLYIDYRKPTQRLVSEVFANKNDDNFTNILRLEEGSMGPKVHACLQFVKNGGKEAVIASLDNVVDAISGRTGTHFYP
jgi:basic membrane protein A and related proteins